MEHQSTLTLFEHQKVSFSELGLKPKNPILEGLEYLNETADTALFEIGRKFIKANQYVGVIQIGSTTIQVLPKIDYLGESESKPGTDNHSLAAYSSTRNLMFLLSYTHDFPIHARDLAALDAKRMDWFDLLILIFAEELFRQITGGLHRNYIEIQETLPVMRGRWEIARQLSRQPFLRHKFDLRYDEFSSDTPLNRVFRHVSERLLIFTRTSSIRILLSNIRDRLLPARRMHSIPQDFLDQIHFTRLNDRFKPAFNLSRMFLENTTFQLATGKQQTFAFLLNMDRLFEKFIEQFILRHRALIFPVDGDTIRIFPQAKANPHYLIQSLPEGKTYHLLRPDLLFSSPTGGKYYLIADMKYKQIDSSQPLRDIAPGDIYQMLAYSARLECPTVLLLYPQLRGSLPIRKVFQALGSPTHFLAATLNLGQELDDPQPLINELTDIFRAVFTNIH